jgi:hypothetical protein
MRLGKRCEVPDGPRDHVSVAVEIAIAFIARTEDTCDVARYRGLFGQHGDISGFRRHHRLLQFNGSGHFEAVARAPLKVIAGQVLGEHGSPGPIGNQCCPN